MVDGGVWRGIIGVRFWLREGYGIGEELRKAISREAHTYQGVVCDLELCDDGGECASLVSRVAAGEVVDWLESRGGMVEVLLGKTSLYLPKWYFEKKFQELPELSLGKRYLSKAEFLEFAPSEYDAYLFSNGEVVHASGQAPHLDPTAYGQDWAAILETAAMVTPVPQFGRDASKGAATTGGLVLDGRRSK